MKSNAALKALGAFMLLMAVLTVASRAADTLTICSVRTAEAQNGALVHKVDGEGRVEAEDAVLVWAIEGLRVAQVLSRAGNTVSRGDVLARFDEDSVRKALDAAQTECKKLEAQNLKTAETSMARTLLDLRRAVETAEQELKSAKRSKEKKSARKELDRAREDLALSEMELAQKMEQERLTLCALEPELSRKRGEIEALAALLRDGCALRATIDGAVVFLSLEAGKETGNEAAACLADLSGALRLSVTVTRGQGKYIFVGDEALVTKPGEKEARSEPVTGVAPAGAGDSQTVTVTLSQTDYVIGANVRVRFSHKTDRYAQCIKASALRGDSSGDFVLVVRKKSGVLGDTAVAERVPVTVLDGDGERVAVEGALYGEEIIVEADKPLSEGDRVRPLDA